MTAWFASESNHPFVMFSFSHITMLILFGLGLVLLFIYKSELMKGRASHTIVRWTLLSALLLSELSYQLWALSHNLFTTFEHLPLHLCGIASITGIFALLTYNKKLIQINFFIAIVPSVIALITPEIPHGYEHFRFWKFFIHHMAIPWTGLFLILSTRTTVHFKVMCETYCYLVVYALAVGLFNQAFQTNYLFLSQPPSSFPALALLSAGLGYQINLALLAFGVFYLFLVFYKVIHTRKRSDGNGIQGNERV
ncbi:TIGR02206 family membrane protein [Halobacillus sp. A5]|uniref:YwaF family protein n=1 Tax=Halobacillus sp. A5 TaxID=2880263 RepID=UPI0020A68609|nr:TIGR02206 family membrane protein [Halobacillus sp. A5]MCP3027515.1 TIGR02206 family membrane protein [Halobacillus sp. A5]